MGNVGLRSSATTRTVRETLHMIRYVATWLRIDGLQSSAPRVFAAEWAGNTIAD